MKRFINTAFGESASWFYAGAAHVAIPLRCPGVPWCEEEDDGQVHLRRRVMKKPELKPSDKVLHKFDEDTPFSKVLELASGIPPEELLITVEHDYEWTDVQLVHRKVREMDRKVYEHDLAQYEKYMATLPKRQAAWDEARAALKKMGRSDELIQTALGDRPE